MLAQKPILWRALSPAAFALVPALQTWMRRPSRRATKRWLFKCILDPYTNCSTAEVVARATYGFSIEGTLSGVVLRSVFHYGVFEPNLSAWVAGSLRAGDTFIDVGANVGYFSLLASRAVGNGGRVVALEPSPSNHAALLRNVATNSADNVRAIQAAAYDRQATLPLYSIPEEEFTSGASLIHRVGPPEADVPAAPLGEMLTREEMRTARIVKIDVEGAEQEVVRGLLASLDEFSPDMELVIEVVPKNAQPIVDMLTPHGFLAFSLDNPMSPLDLSDSGETGPVRLRSSRGAESELQDGPVGYLVFSRQLEGSITR